jgi:hypothetical protein
VGGSSKSTFGNKLLGRSYRERHCHKPWFDVDCHIAKCELRLWLKANPDSHVTKHQENKLKNLLKRKKKFWEIAKAQHMCVLAKVNALKKYRPKALVMDKISVIMLLKGFCRLAG